jgi:beta-glucosidase/6-phospho-beta-glucosidase/beta-galactosidase
MATGFPASTGDVLSAPMFNELVQYTINTQSGTTYTFASTDQYQVLVLTSNASAKTVSIPTDATTNFAIGTVITVLNTGTADTTIQAASAGTTTVTSAGASSAAPKVGLHKAAACIKTAANTWRVIGAVS